jgi:flagellar motor switch protein FliM
MSTSDLLSQEEIDALLSGVDSGDIDTDADDAQGAEGVRGYDFATQDRIVRGRLPTLEMINERFARNFRISLFNLLRRSPVISVEGIQVQKFGEYTRTLLVPSNMNIVKVQPLRGAGLVVFNPKLVFALVDCFFGGEGRFHTKIEGRDFTATEMRIVEKVRDLVFHDLEAAWEPVKPLKFEFMNAEVNPQFANIVSPSEVIVVCKFHVDIDAGAGHLDIAMPYAMLEPIRDILDAGVQSDVAEPDERWSKLMREELRGVDVEVNATLCRTRLKMRDVLGFEPGTIVPIEAPGEVVAKVQGVPVLAGQYGVSRGNLAIRVSRLGPRDELAEQQGETP